MKKALAYVRALGVENLDEAGLEKISGEMDSFSSKEQFEVLLCIFARFLGTIGSEQIPSETVGNLGDAPTNDGIPPADVSPVSEVTVDSLTDTQLQAALANLPAEADHTANDKAVIRAYRARFARR